MDLELTPEERELLAKDDHASQRFGYWLQAVLTLIAASALIVVVQAFLWLRTGDWPSLSIRDALEALEIHPVPISWVGLQRIVDWLWELPLSGVLFALAIVVVLVLTRGDQSMPEALSEARMKQARQRFRDGS
jgi:hypothetical protein